MWGDTSDSPKLGKIIPESGQYLLYLVSLVVLAWMGGAEITRF